MKQMVIIAGLVLSVFSGLAESASSEGGNTRDAKGMTADDLGRGLKSAAQNVEREIPKIGSAIGNAVKKMTEKRTDNQSSQEPARQKK